MNLLPTNIIKEAIEKGGYRYNWPQEPPYKQLPARFGSPGDYVRMNDAEQLQANMKAWVPRMVGHPHVILLDKLFWQSLGNARGWTGYTFICGKDGAIDGANVRFGETCGKCNAKVWSATHSEHYAIEFFRVVLSSPTQEQVDEFWRSLP